MPSESQQSALQRARNRVGGLALAASRDPREYTAAARQTFRDSFQEAVDPDRVLPTGERLRRADAARRLWFARMALKSAKSRQKKTAGDHSSAARPELGSTDHTQPTEPIPTAAMSV